jgi:maltose O-acetyltransferase
MKTEWEKMVGGEPFQSNDPDLVARRERCRQLLNRLNSRVDGAFEPERYALIAELLQIDVRHDIVIQTPFHCDYGTRIRCGKNFYVNFDCVILDGGGVTFGDNVMIAPKVQIYTAFHPFDPIIRAVYTEGVKPVQVGNDVWIGGGSILLPGVTIGDNTIIGAGSVVTRDIPANVVAAGNPCRIIRHLNPAEYGKRPFEL